MSKKSKKKKTKRNVWSDPLVASDDKDDIRVMIIKPYEPPRIEVMPFDMDKFMEIIGSKEFTHHINYEYGFLFFYDEKGEEKGLPLNMTCYSNAGSYYKLYGTVIVFGYTYHDFMNLTDEQAYMLTEVWARGYYLSNRQ